MQEWLDRKAAAKYIGVSTTTIWRWVSQGLIKVYYLPNGQKRYKKSDLDALINSATEKYEEVANYGA